MDQYVLKFLSYRKFSLENGVVSPQTAIDNDVVIFVHRPEVSFLCHPEKEELAMTLGEWAAKVSSVLIAVHGGAAYHGLRITSANCNLRRRRFSKLGPDDTMNFYSDFKVHVCQTYGLESNTDNFF